MPSNSEDEAKAEVRGNFYRNIKEYLKTSHPFKKIHLNYYCYYTPLKCYSKEDFVVSQLPDAGVGTVGWFLYRFHSQAAAPI